MAYETGTASGVGDLMVKWFNFLQANGWTADVDWTSASQSPAWGIINRKVQLSPEDDLTVNLQCAFAIANTDTHGTGINMIPMRDYVSGDPQDAFEVGTSTAAHNQTSGAGHMRTNIPADPYDAYHFFAEDYYAHAVVEFQTGLFRHFGMSWLNKVGRYRGGEMFHNTFRDQTTTHIDSKDSTSNIDPFDARHLLSYPMHLYGIQMDGTAFPEHLAGSPQTKWHRTYHTVQDHRGTDADGVNCGTLHIDGNKQGFHYSIASEGTSQFNGYRPMFPINVWLMNSATAPDAFRLVGTVPNVRMINMLGGLEPNDEFTIGADDWIVFPHVRKREILVSDNTETSGGWGLAYKKIV